MTVVVHLSHGVKVITFEGVCIEGGAEFWKLPPAEQTSLLQEARYRLPLAEREEMSNDNRRHDADGSLGRKPRPGFVYLVRGPEGTCKIGCTSNLEKRLRSFATGHSGEHILLHAIQTDDCHGLERRLHERYATKRVKGEWFTLGAADIEQLRRMSV